LIVLSVYGLWRLWLGISSRQWAQAAALAALMAAAALLTSASSRNPAVRARLWSLDPYNLGVKELAIAETLLDQGGAVEQQAANHTMAQEELRHAEQHLRRAYSWLQANPGILFALGNLSLDRGDSAQARQWYERTLELAPGYAGALKNLGYLDVQAGQWASANEHLSAARAIEAENASTCYLLAKAKIGLGDRASARTVLEEALRMKPNQPEFLELQKTLAEPDRQP
jgi:Flp pilus assembly protein TadD